MTQFNIVLYSVGNQRKIRYFAENEKDKAKEFCELVNGEMTVGKLKEKTK